MSVDTATVKRVAHLARIAITEEEAGQMTGDLNNILGFIEQLNEVNIDGVQPLTSVVAQDMKKRVDEVTDGGYPETVVANAPDTEDHFFLVPKVVE